jgi:pyruvate dehydrogenase E1 component alpha subunit
MHIADFSIGILGANGVVAGGLPIIAGAGFSIKMRKTDQVAVCFFGDGAANRGPVHEVMNLASIWNLPIIFVIENNRYASTTPQSHACSLDDICLRAGGYNMPGIAVDGNDVLSVRQAVLPAVERARRGEGPSLIENKTYRIRGHFEGDPQKYRTRSEVQDWQDQRDPIRQFADFLIGQKVLTPDLDQQIREEVAAELKEAVAFAESSPFPQPQEALEDLYANENMKK